MKNQLNQKNIKSKYTEVTVAHEDTFTMINLDWVLLHKINHFVRKSNIWNMDFIIQMSESN